MAGSDRKGPEGLRQCFLTLLCKVGHNSTATEKCEYLETASQKSVSVFEMQDRAFCVLEKQDVVR